MNVMICFIRTQPHSTHSMYNLSVCKMSWCTVLRVQCSQCDALLLRCLDCHEDTQHVTTLSSLHRSKVGSISAAEAVKSLQQPVLVKADPEHTRGGLIFSRTLHPLPRPAATKVGIYVIASYWRQTRMWPVDKHGAEAGSGGHQAAPDVLPRPPAAPLPPLGLRSAS